MATRSADIAAGSAVDLTAALSLRDGTSYYVGLGPTAFPNDFAVVALDGDPDAVGGHVVDAIEGQLVRQFAGTTWFVRVERDTSLTATEAGTC